MNDSPNPDIGAGRGLAASLIAAIGGDLSGLRLVETSSEEDLAVAAAVVGKVRLTAGAVRRVLDGLVGGSISPGDALTWARLMMWGRVRPVDPGADRASLTFISVDYDGHDEHAIADAVSRLDLIHDDGPPDSTELRDLISRFGESRARPSSDIPEP